MRRNDRLHLTGFSVLNTFARVTTLGRVAADAMKLRAVGAVGFTLVVANAPAPSLVIQVELRGELASRLLASLRSGALVYVEGELVSERTSNRGESRERYVVRAQAVTVVADKHEAEGRAEPAPAPAKKSEPVFGHIIDEEQEPEPV